jgi:antitoxin component of RelBE/YafQ-DinJ toxin-antitoxin module
MAQKTMLWARVDKEIRDLVEKLAKAKGISISEYVRGLILEDLNERAVFTDALKRRKSSKLQKISNGVKHAREAVGAQQQPTHQRLVLSDGSICKG